MLKKVWITAAAALAIGLAGITTEVDAKRLGGGRNVGQQNSTVDRGPGQQPQQMNQAGQSQSAQSAAAARQQQAAQSPRNRWLGPVAGLAAGLGLAWLASSLGLGEEFGTILLLLLVGMIALVAFRMFMARRAAGAAGQNGTGAFRGMPGRDLAYGGAGAAGPQVNRSSWQTAGGAAGGGAAGTATAAATGAALANFDAEQFVRAARNQFVRLQAAFDSGRTDELREFTSQEMFTELQREIAERGGSAQTTEILTLEADLVGTDRVGPRGDDLASVRFSGLLRESPQEPAQTVDEVWNFIRAADGSSGWVLAGIQQRTA